MSRLRTLACLVALAVAATLAPATTAAAATQLTAAITCDPATGAITTRVSGTLLAPGAPTPVTVEFQRRGGVRVTATTWTYLSGLAQPVAVRTTTTASGDIAATGYTGTFDPATSLYYRETVVATFKNTSTGDTYTTREATCDHDQRTTVTLACDPAAGTVTATATGRDGQAGAGNGSGRPVRVGYRIVRTSQSTADSPRFTSQILGQGYDVEHRVTQAADGTWSDTGYVHTITSNPYYYAEELTVGVFDAFGAFAGSGTTRCTLFDGSSSIAQ